LLRRAHAGSIGTTLEISSHSDGSYEIYPLPKITGTIFKYVGLVLVIFNEIVELQILSGCFLKDSNYFIRMNIVD